MDGYNTFRTDEFAHTHTHTQSQRHHSNEKERKAIAK